MFRNIIIVSCSLFLVGCASVGGKELFRTSYESCNMMVKSNFNQCTNLDTLDNGSRGIYRRVTYYLVYY